jgi:NAD(P)-dependent dehydrogenase (short-subunit alcohol dehydrogenase family)
MSAPSAPGLRDAVIIVTGAGSGIGAATARQLSAAGASTVLVGRRKDALEAQADRIAAAGGDAYCVAADLAEPDSPGKIAAACRDRYGRIDGLVNNAAIVRHWPIGEWTTEAFDEHFATNVRAPYFLIQAVLQSVYGTTKAAVNYLTRTLAGELAPAGVRVNCIAPGPIDTPIHATWADDLDEAYRWLAQQVPLGRIGTADEVARWIALLLSPVASFITGAVIPLDGGQVLHRD